VLGDRTEALVYILAHELRTCISNTGTQDTPASPWAGSRTTGRYSEVCTGVRSMAMVVERTFAWLNEFRRLRVRYEKRADIRGILVPGMCSDLLALPEPIGWRVERSLSTHLTNSR
jgi:hypothetical protein